MNVPAIAKKSFDELKAMPEFMHIVQTVLNKLQKISSHIKRTKLVHQLIDEYNTDVFSNPVVKELSPCKMGCSFCCHTQVSVTEDEAIVLASRIQDGLQIDRERLNRQMFAGNDPQAFFRLNHLDRRCVFLDDNGACLVYKDRPSVCRTNAVIGDPEQCDTSKSVQSTRLVMTKKADMVIYASFLFARKSGSLPNMVGTILKEQESEVS